MAVLSFRCERPAVAVWLGVAIVQLPVDMHMLMACGLRAKLLDQPHLAQDAHEHGVQLWYV